MINQVSQPTLKYHVLNSNLPILREPDSGLSHYKSGKKLTKKSTKAIVNKDGASDNFYNTADNIMKITDDSLKIGGSKMNITKQ